MLSLTNLFRLIVVCGLLSAAACGGNGKAQGKGGAGGQTGGASGASGAGGMSGAGGTADASGAGGAGNTACPSARPSIGAACTFTSGCAYQDICRCGICCQVLLGCTNGAVTMKGYDDGCVVVTCTDGGAGTSGAGGTAGAGGAAAVCTPGADQSCNDNPAWSSIHGHCTDAGACACSDAGTNPDSGRCL